MERRLDRPQDLLVHHLERRRHDALGDDPGHRPAGIGHRLEHSQEGAHRLRERGQSHRDLGHHPEGPFVPNHQARQVVSRALGHRPAELGDRAVGEDERHPEHVVGSDPVLQGVRAARVGGHVAADRARRLARRIRCIVESMGLCGPAERQIRHPGFDHRELVHRIQVQDALHPAQADDDRVRCGHRAAREARARTARDERDLGPMEPLEHRRHFGGRPREDDRARHRLLERVAVALVGDEARRLGDHAVGPDHRFELGSERSGPAILHAANVARIARPARPPAMAIGQIAAPPAGAMQNAAAGTRVGRPTRRHPVIPPQPPVARRPACSLQHPK